MAPLVVLSSPAAGAGLSERRRKPKQSEGIAETVSWCQGLWHLSAGRLRLHVCDAHLGCRFSLQHSMPHQEAMEKLRNMCNRVIGPRLRPLVGANTELQGHLECNGIGEGFLRLS